MAYRSAWSLFTTSKDAVLNNPLPFLTLVFLPSFLIVVGDAMNGGKSLSFPMTAKTAPESEASQLVYLIGGLLSLLFIAAGFCLELKAAKGKTISASEALTSSMRYFWRLLGLLIVMTVVIVLGLLALIVPGIIFIQRYFLAPYFLIDKDLGIRESMTASAAASKGKAGAIWSIIGVMVLFSLFSFIPIFGGLITLVLVTLFTCAPAYRYFELTGKKTR
ncbi:MAG: YciC family protein [Patescibacteria group bacterium]